MLSGGVGAAKLLSALSGVVDPGDLVAVVNIADDTILQGLYVSPDLDTVTYTLAGEINPQTGWGLRDESWQAMTTVERYGGTSWFRLGDRDLGTHLYRTQRLAEGAALSTVTSEITRAWGLEQTLLPASDARVETRVTVVDEGEIGFQEYFVRRRHDVVVTDVRFVGAETALPAPGVVDAIRTAERVIIAPSNPIVSIGPMLAIAGLRSAIVDRRADVVAVSGIVGGKALKGPADRLMRELGHEPTAAGVAAIYAPLAATIVIDTVDAELETAVAATGVTPVVADTIMSDPARSEQVARSVLEASP